MKSIATSYSCPDCNTEIEVWYSEKLDIGGKEYWGGNRTCPQCKKPAFVMIFADGSTLASRAHISAHNTKGVPA
jgi:hypothetical protein